MFISFYAAPSNTIQFMIHPELIPDQRIYDKPHVKIKYLFQPPAKSLSQPLLTHQKRGLLKVNSHEDRTSYSERNPNQSKFKSQNL
ncbi:hypothetical protein CEXT_345391 [Caerostris extrusa]|uniref:Uncharacterized protein n=1 Tax=Caerostris extrusa TaxID=172846 RepID=A0AAV4W7M7_CAEEX|nr:hypothetical protein CEXT_345391 [Caerostris extrusa]